MRFNLRISAPDLSLPFSAFGKASVSAADLWDPRQGQRGDTSSPIVCTHDSGRMEGLYNPPAPVHEPAVTKPIRT